MFPLHEQLIGTVIYMAMVYAVLILFIRLLT